MSGKDSSKVSMFADKITMFESDSFGPHIDCDVCGIRFSQMKLYESHLQGKKHQKKMSKSKFLACKNEVNWSDDDDDDDNDDDESSKHHCEVCDKYVSGYKSYATHLISRKHIKKVKKLKLKQKLGDMPELHDRESKEADDAGTGKPYARCTICMKEFSGPEPFNLHLKSAAHKKKIKQIQAVQNLKTEGSRESDDDSSDPSAFYGIRRSSAFYSKCDICQKSFIVPTPYQIHMSSGVHAKNVEKQKVAEEMKQYYVSEDNSGYVCDECEKIFTNLMVFKSHLACNNHDKPKDKNVLLEFLTSDPEILFVTPIDNENSEESDVDGSDYYLICKICNISFSSLESAKEHVKSQKHISTKKEKKILKQLKEQKNSPSDKQGDDTDKNSSAIGVSMNEIVKNNNKTENAEKFEVI